MNNLKKTFLVLLLGIIPNYLSERSDISLRNIFDDRQENNASVLLHRFVSFRGKGHYIPKLYIGPSRISEHRIVNLKENPSASVSHLNFIANQQQARRRYQYLRNFGRQRRQKQQQLADYDTGRIFPPENARKKYKRKRNSWLFGDLSPEEEEENRLAEITNQWNLQYNRENMKKLGHAVAVEEPSNVANSQPFRVSGFDWNSKTEPPKPMGTPNPWLFGELTPAEEEEKRLQDANAQWNIQYNLKRSKEVQEQKAEQRRREEELQRQREEELHLQRQREENQRLKQDNRRFGSRSMSQGQATTSTPTKQWYQPQQYQIPSPPTPRPQEKPGTINSWLFGELTPEEEEEQRLQDANAQWNIQYNSRRSKEVQEQKAEQRRREEERKRNEVQRQREEDQRRKQDERRFGNTKSKQHMRPVKEPINRKDDNPPTEVDFRKKSQSKRGQQSSKRKSFFPGIFGRASWRHQYSHFLVAFCLIISAALNRWLIE